MPTENPFDGTDDGELRQKAGIQLLTAGLRVLNGQTHGVAVLACDAVDMVNEVNRRDMRRRQERIDADREAARKR